MVLLNPNSQAAASDHRIGAADGAFDATNNPMEKESSWPFSFGRDDFILLLGQQLDHLGYR